MKPSYSSIMIGMIKRNCKNCGKVFSTYQCYIERGKRNGKEEGIFCSRSCRSTGKFNVKYKDGEDLVDKTCLHCGNGFSVSPRVVRRRPAKYCSRQCVNLARRYSGKTSKVMNGYRYILDYQHPNRIDGKWVAEHRLVVENNLNRLLDSNEAIHHKDGNKLNNVSSNLEVMSFSDHAILHWKERKVEVTV